MKLSEKILNYESIENLEPAIQQKLIINSVSIVLFTGICGSLPNVFGYNFKEIFGVVNAIFLFTFVTLLISFYIKIINQNNKYHIFKKKKYLTTFVLASIIITLSMCISAYFTTYYTINEVTGLFSIHVNMFFYFVVFWPILIIYITVSWYAFMKKCNEYNMYAKKKKE
jgi:chromate transport protein ChrA